MQTAETVEGLPLNFGGHTSLVYYRLFKPVHTGLLWRCVYSLVGSRYPSAALAGDVIAAVCAEERWGEAVDFYDLITSADPDGPPPGYFIFDQVKRAGQPLEIGQRRAEACTSEIFAAFSHLVGDLLEPEDIFTREQFRGLSRRDRARSVEILRQCLLQIERDVDQYFRRALPIYPVHRAIARGYCFHPDNPRHQVPNGLLLQRMERESVIVDLRGSYLLQQLSSKSLRDFRYHYLPKRFMLCAKRLI